jgi:hypothetical protein
VLLGNGDGSFGAPVNYTVGGQPRAALVGDFDRNGKPGLAVVNQMSGTVSVLRGNGDGTFGTPVNYLVGQQEPTSLAAGDFNGDGFLDLVAGNSVLLNAADGPPGPARAAAPRRHPSPPGGAFRGDPVAASARFVPPATEPGRPLPLTPAAETVRPPLRVADVGRFLATLAGEKGEPDASRFAPAVPRVLPGRSRDTARRDGVPGLWEVPALL